MSGRITVGGPGLREGGPTSYKRGSLKRRLPIVTICELSQSTEDSIEVNTVARLLLKNLNANLKCHIIGAVASNVGNVPIRPELVPAGAATMQLIPKVIAGDSTPMFLRPVFQDPTLADNENHPLAQDLPYGWEFSTNADEVDIEITVNFAAWGGTNLNGKVLVMADIEYDGSEWDIKAIQYSIAQVQMSSYTPFDIFTGGG